MCFSQYFNMKKTHAWKILLKQSVLVEKKTLCFGRKNSKNCAWLKVFLSHFHKVLPKQMCFGQYFNMCMEISFYWNKTLCFGRKKTARTVLDQKCFSHFFIKFYWNKCVSVNILICAWKNSTKTKCFGKKKQQELCLIKSVSVTFL